MGRGPTVGMKWTTASDSTGHTAKAQFSRSSGLHRVVQPSAEASGALTNIITLLHQKLDAKMIWSPVTGSMVLLGLIPQLLAAAGMSQFCTLLSIQA